MSAPEPPHMDGSQPCATSNPEAWFPESWTSDNRAAIAICRTCHYREPCLDYALLVNVVGIWGATTDADRRRIRKERGIKVTPVWMTMFTPTPGALRLRAKRAQQPKEDQP
jgi:hypothetical protein